MKKITLLVICIMILTSSLTGYGKSASQNTSVPEAVSPPQSSLPENSEAGAAELSSAPSVTEPVSAVRNEEKEEHEEDEKMYRIQLEIGTHMFSANLYKNETTEALIERLPLSLSMDELNGNEKYYYFSEALPQNPSRPQQIKAGDIMLFGSDCLVVFYENVSSSYRYTSLGYIEEASDLAEAVGTGTAAITFRLEVN